MMDKYTYRVTWAEEDGEYVGLCAEFPSLSWLAETPYAAFKGIRQVVDDAVSDMEAHNELVPKPIATKQFSGNNGYGLYYAELSCQAFTNDNL
jgi:predicted RNase H-like HicB family nuclease